MPNPFASFLSACVLCSVSAAALAQPASPPNIVSPVTVNAPPRAKTIEKQTHTFVQGHAAAQNPEVGQIGRWQGPVCVQVVGLPHVEHGA